tara:strand:- start:633 stop:887 length:255 start_codon:yes stop_codon:yes gene_type:complete
MIQIKEEKIFELMFDIWHKSDILENPVVVGKYIAEELKQVKNLAIHDVMHLLTEYEKFASGENYINSKPLIDKQIKEFIEVNCA